MMWIKDFKKHFERKRLVVGTVVVVVSSLLILCFSWSLSYLCYTNIIIQYILLIALFQDPHLPLTSPPKFSVVCRLSTTDRCDTAQTSWHSPLSPPPSPSFCRGRSEDQPTTINSPSN